MRKILLCLVVFGAVACSWGTADAAITIHTTNGSWTSTINGLGLSLDILREEFSDSTLEPGLSFELIGPSGSHGVNGGVDLGANLFRDILTGYESTDPNGERIVEATNSTVWSFASPTYGFSQDWSVPRSSPGGTQGAPEQLHMGISVYMNDDIVAVGSISPGHSGFWGFTSDSAFNKVVLKVGTAVGGVNQPYISDNLQFTRNRPQEVVPEPAAAFVWSVLGCVAVTFGSLRRRRR